MSLKPADFQRVLATRAWSRSSYFSLHHDRPVDQLSTGQQAAKEQLVDESSAQLHSAAQFPSPQGQRLGLVVPKRLARRAVTRTLIKRQARVAWQAHCFNLPAGDWVVCLRAPISREQFPSAASCALKELIALELAGLFKSALQRVHQSALTAIPNRVSGNERQSDQANSSNRH